MQGKRAESPKSTKHGARHYIWTKMNSKYRPERAKAFSFLQIKKIRSNPRFRLANPYHPCVIFFNRKEREGLRKKKGLKARKAKSMMRSTTYEPKWAATIALKGKSNFHFFKSKKIRFDPRFHLANPYHPCVIFFNRKQREGLRKEKRAEGPKSKEHGAKHYEINKNNVIFALKRQKRFPSLQIKKKSVPIRVFAWRTRIIRVLFFLTAKNAKVYAKHARKKGWKPQKHKAWREALYLNQNEQ